MYKQFFPAECKDGHKGDTCRGIIQKYEDLWKKKKANITSVANEIVNCNNDKLKELFNKIQDLQDVQLSNYELIIDSYKKWPPDPVKDKREYLSIMREYLSITRGWIKTISEDQKRIDELENQIRSI